MFFSTGQSLLPQDPGLVDIYDARSGGGFPPPEAGRSACEGDGCQPVPAGMLPQQSGSTAFSGPGNQKPKKKPKQSCRKGKGKKKSCKRSDKAKEQGNKKSQGSKKKGGSK